MPESPKSDAKAKAEASTADYGAAGRILTQRWQPTLDAYFSLPRSKERPPNATAVDAEEKRFVALHDNLQRAYLDRDAVKLEMVATAHLAAQAATSADSSRMPLDIYQFFKGKGCSATVDELLRLAGNYTKTELANFLAHSAELVSELKAQALAAIVNGTLVTQKVDLIFQIKAILAFQLVAKAVLDEKPKEVAIPIKLICKMLHLDIHFPGWTFDIDPCRWPKHTDEKEGAHPAHSISPLKEKLEKEQRMMSAKLMEKTIAAEQGRGDGPNASVKPGEGRGDPPAELSMGSWLYSGALSGCGRKLLIFLGPRILRRGQWVLPRRAWVPS